MSRAPEMFGLVRYPLLRCDARMFRHRFGNHGIQTTVENVELLDREARCSSASAVIAWQMSP